MTTTAIDTAHTGSLLWSFAGNWSPSTPTSGDEVTQRSDTRLSEDDIANLSLSSLTMFARTEIDVLDTNLTVGALVLFGGSTTLEVFGGALTITGPVTATGSLNVLSADSPGGVLDDEASVDPGLFYQAVNGGEVILGVAPSSQSVLSFQSNGIIVLKDPGATVAASVRGLAPGDTLELPGSKVLQIGAAGNDLKITTDNGIFDFTNVSYSSNVTGYTDNGVDAVTGLDSITFTTGSNIVACYCRGTLILTERGEVAVEHLAIGDRVVTSSGATRPIRWIGTRSYSGRFALGQKHILPICIKAGALDDNVPRRDLWISPHHAMYLQGVLIEARDLVNGISLVQAEQVESVEYFHIELDSHDVIIAEGALSESFVDDESRGVFHNAHEYRALYPGASQAPARYCAPRRHDGYEVEAARNCIDTRAGLRTAAADLSGLRGYVDIVSHQFVRGWAQNVDYPEVPVCLDIYADGRLIGQTLANRYREDLAGAGLGSGNHGFEFILPSRSTFAPDAIELRRSLDGVALGCSADMLAYVPARQAMSSLGKVDRLG